jgi:hypothetical protein
MHLSEAAVYIWHMQWHALRRHHQKCLSHFCVLCYAAAVAAVAVAEATAAAAAQRQKLAVAAYQTVVALRNQTGCRTLLVSSVFVCVNS